MGLPHWSAPEGRPEKRPPVNQETPVVLADGQAILVRPIQPTDAPRLQQLHARLSERSIYYRFFGVMPRLSDHLAQRLAEVDYTNQFALVALVTESPDELIGVARFGREPGAEEAEVAIELTDHNQGQGLGRVLVVLLAEAAHARKIKRLSGVVLADNHWMIRLLRGLGYPYRTTWENGLLRVVVDIA